MTLDIYIYIYVYVYVCIYIYTWYPAIWVCLEKLAKPPKTELFMTLFTQYYKGQLFHQNQRTHRSSWGPSWDPPNDSGPFVNGESGWVTYLFSKASRRIFQFSVSVGVWSQISFWDVDLEHSTNEILLKPCRIWDVLNLGSLKTSNTNHVFTKWIIPLISHL
jgi:hypothetical protein